MPTLAELTRTPNALAPHYSRFRVGERLLLTGHSHQAWPDAGFEGQIEAWNDAAELVDGKWERAFAKADRVRRGFATLLGCDAREIALAGNTHELVVRFLSALPLAKRPRLITTDGEFHTLRRQLDRVAEAGVAEVVKIPADRPDEIAPRILQALDDRTAAVLVSSVLFGSGRIVRGLGAVAVEGRRRGAEVLIDVYHHLNVVPFSVREMSLGEAFIVGGGYKYCQLGEGNCFMRVPPGTALLPVITGWYSEFARLEQRAAGQVPFGEGAARWAGATYDPTSHYRAARVFDFFEREGLGAKLLREVSQHQVGLLAAEFDRLGLNPALVTRDRSVPLDQLGGFLALASPHALDLSRKLKEKGVSTDARGELLRFGPAPYLADAQITAAMAALGETVRDLRG